MRKFYISLLLLNLILSLVCVNPAWSLSAENQFSYLNMVTLEPETGIDSFYVHRWGIRIIDFDYSTSDGNMNALVAELSKLIASLDNGRFSLILGKNYPERKVVYVEPIIMTGSGTEVNLTALLGGDFALGTIRLEKGTALPIPILLLNNLTSTLFTEIIPFTPAAPTLNIPTNLSELLNTTIVYPYNYSREATSPPAPLLDPKNLGFYATFWGSIYILQFGFTGRVVEHENSIDFYLKGRNNSFLELNNTALGLALDSVFRYHRDTGVLTDLYADITLIAYNNSEQILNYNLRFSLSYMGGEKLHMGLRNGEKMGYTVTSFNYSSSVFDLLKNLQSMGLIGNVTLNLTEIEEALNSVSKANFTLIYNDTLSENGIDLRYHVYPQIPQNLLSLLNLTLANITLLNMTPFLPETTITINAINPGSIYLLGAWLESAGLMQATNIITPQTTLFNLPISQGSVTVNIDGSTKLMKSTNGQYYSYIGNVTIKYTQPELTVNQTTIPGISISLTILSWATYNATGKLIEATVKATINRIEVTLDKIDFIFKEDIQAEAKINLVRNSNGHPDFSTPIDAPDPSSDWQDISPASENVVIGEVSDNNSPTVEVLAFEAYRNETATAFELEVNVTDESPIVKVYVSYNSTIVSELTYYDDTKTYKTKFTLNGTVKEANFTITAIDAHGNEGREVYEYKASGGEVGQLIGAVVAVSIIVAVAVLFVYVWRKR